MSHIVREAALSSTIVAAPGAPLSFADLIAPVEATTFFDTYWERQPLYVPSTNRERFLHLLSTADVNQFLAHYGRTHALGVRLSKHQDGRTEIVDLSSEHVLVDVDRVFAAYLQGFTVNINDVEERHAPVRELARSLSTTFGCMVKVNVYLTPADAAAFPLHLDTHDVLVLQLEGKKAWRVYAPSFPWPTKTQRPKTEIPRDTVGAPLEDLVLEAGDVLYVPRGFGHEVCTQNQSSLHVTVGIHSFTFLDLIEKSLEIVGWDVPRLRRSIPPQAVTDERLTSELRAELQALRAVIADRLPLEEGLTRLAAQWLTILPPASAERFDAVDPGVVKGLRTDTRVRKRPATRCRVVEGYGWMAIQYPSHAVSLPARMGPALEYIARTDEFDATSLPGHLTDEERVALVQRLITEGLLMPA